MRNGGPHRGGLPGQPDRVTLLAEFSPCESRRWGNPPNWGDVYPGIYQLWLPTTTSLAGFSDNFIFKTSSEENTEEVDGASDNLSVEFDNKAELLKCLKEYKVTCDFNENEFQQDLSAMYTKIRRCLAIDYFDEFGPKSTTQPETP